MAEQRNSIEETPYDPLVPYLLQGVKENIPQHRKLCPLFATKDGYKAANKACGRCHLAMVCLYLQDALHTGERIAEVKTELDVTHFYDESEFHQKARPYVELLAKTVAAKDADGEAMTVERVRTAVERDVPGRMKNHDPNAVEIIMYALRNHELLKIEGGCFVRR